MVHLDRMFSSAGPARIGPLLLALLTAAGGCGEPDELEGAGAATVPVRLQAVTRVDRPARIRFSGEVDASRRANVGFLVPGLVASVGPEEGDQVRRGQVLATLDPADYQMNHELVAAQLASAEDELRRARAVHAERGISDNDLQKAETAVRVLGVQERMAAKKLADSEIRSPMDGIVARRSIEPGEQAGPGMPIFTIMQVNPAVVRVGVPQAEIGGIVTGQRADVTVPSLGDAIFPGQVSLVGIAADPQSRSYNVEVAVENRDYRLRPGMIAEVELELDGSVDALTVPGEAIVRDGNGVTRVFVYSPGEQRVHSRRVEIGAAHGTEIEIRSGLQGDELIVVGGQHRLREGSPVEVVDGPTTAPRGPAEPDSADEGTAPGEGDAGR